MIRLSFGTAGIRAPLGPGLDQLNAFTVTGVAHALFGYLREQFTDAAERGVCVAFDGRRQSDQFAAAMVQVARSYGLTVRAFEQPTPTPVLAYCTRAFSAVAGIEITASHNPPSDNGIKLYMAGGAQVLAPHDHAIAERIARYRETDAPPDGIALGVYQTLGERELEGYLETITRVVPPRAGGLPAFAYTALHGVGSQVTRRLFARVGAEHVHEVAEQAEPRADLGGLASPNPEHEGALRALRDRAERAQLDLAFAHDPDADRLAVLARDRHGVLRTLSGDQVGALIGDYLLGRSQVPAHELLVSTLVSGELLERIVHARGAQFARTPTGFKWIASRARALERERGLDFLFGYEEAIGYAFGRIADDKDGIAALAVLLELTRELHAQGQTLAQRLDALARAHGVFVTRQLSVPRGAGNDDLVARLRELDPARLLGPGSTRIDYAREPEAIELLVFRRAGSRVCVRPSGTEPKLKLYLHAHASGELDEAERCATLELDRLEQCMRAV